MAGYSQPGERGLRIAQSVLIALFIAWMSVASWYRLPPPYYQDQTIHTGGQSAEESANDKIAQYTGWLALFTFALVVVSAFQIGFLIRADTTASIAANAARDAADNQFKDTRILQRAYLSVEPGGIRPYGGDDDRIACDIIIHNAGNLVASHVAWCIEKKYGEDMNDKLFPIPSKLVGDIVLAPKGTARKGAIPTNRETFDKWRRDAQPDRAWLYVWGRVSYHDGFRPDRYIDFCHRYNLRGAGAFEIPKENGRYHEHGNRTDEESVPEAS